MSLKTLEHEVARLPESDREEAEDAVTAVGSVLIQDTGALIDVARINSRREIGQIKRRGTCVVCLPSGAAPARSR